MVTNKWEEKGKYYGYPDCCIKSFCKGHSYSKKQIMVHNSSGFIPCKKHAQQILDGKITLSDLIQNRICKTPFPNDDN